MQPDKSGNYWDPSRENEQSAFNTPTAQPVVSTASHRDTYHRDGDVYEKEIVSWQASEHLQHNNGLGWYLGFAGVTLVLIGLSIWWQAWTFTALILVMAIAGIIYTRRPPRVMRYTLSDKGLYVGDVLHSYSEFRSFGVVNDSGIFSIIIVPVKRFAMGMNIYFAPEDGERIVDAFGSRLPMEAHRLDGLDRLLRKLRF